MPEEYSFSKPAAQEQHIYEYDLIGAVGLKKRRSEKAAILYHVKWKGFGIRPMTWEPEHHFFGLDLEALREYIARPRASLSPSQFDDRRFEEFAEACERATNEASAMADVTPIIAGGGRKKYRSVTDAQFTTMSPILEDATAPKPDIYDGALPGRIDPRVRHSLSGHIVPSKDTSQPVAPNLFFEGKSAKGRADVAKRQACYDDCFRHTKSV